MNIDKSKLKIGVWYEDKDGNVVNVDKDVYVEKDRYPEIVSYHTCFPLQVSHEIRFYYDNKDTCKHPLRFRKRTTGWVKGIKGCVCNACGKTKTGKSYIPFMLMPWDKGSDKYDGFTSRVSMSRFSGKCIVAMVNSGDYELDEAIVVMAHACERCMNVLEHKYLNGEDGYEEYSDEWYKANTECDFCREGN